MGAEAYQPAARELTLMGSCLFTPYLIAVCTLYACAVGRFFLKLQNPAFKKSARIALPEMIDGTGRPSIKLH
jgi:hypothetical protein